MLYLNVTICIPRESGSSDCIARMIAEPLPAGVLLNILWCLPWALCRPLVIMDQIEGKPNHYYAPGESHGLRTPAGYSPKGFKDWASKHVCMHASHSWGCHCWTKVSKRLNAEIIGERIFGTTGWFLIFAYQMWKWLTSNDKYWFGQKVSSCFLVTSYMWWFWLASNRLPWKGSSELLHKGLFSFSLLLLVSEIVSTALSFLVV